MSQEPWANYEEPNPMAWFHALPLREQRKQIRRWRYHRMYQRKRLGDSWKVIWSWECGLL